MQETRRAVLDALADGPRSGSALADELGVSRAAVWNHVEALREAGFEIEAGRRGYELVAVPEYGAAAIECGLEAPLEVRFTERTGSTNDDARALAEAGAADVVVVAEAQTGGRGRLDREWASPPGGIWCSILVRPDLPPAAVPLLTLAAAVSVTRAAREAGVEAGIKWPNDVLVSEANEGSEDERSESSGVLVSDRGERTRARKASGSEPSGVSVPAPQSGATGEAAKLAGVLTEMEGEADRVAWVVVGIGVNANVDADGLPPGATSLREHVGDVDRRRFVQRLLETFDELRADPDAVLPAWREHALTLGRRVRVETATGTGGSGPAGEDGVVVGTAVDVEYPGALVVETDDGERVRVHAGDCEHLRPV